MFSCFNVRLEITLSACCGKKLLAVQIGGLMKKIQYRSSGLPVGVFNKPGLIHIHIDGAESPGQILEIVKALEVKGHLGTLDYVLASEAGPQREAEPETYEAHTPVLEGEEAFDFFASIMVDNRQAAIEAVCLIGDMLRRTSGAIIELEQNVAWVSASGFHRITEAEELPIIQSAEIVLGPKQTMRYEIHHAIELPKSQGAINISRLARFCKKSGMMFGGWFVFDDGDKWGYWSNSFSNGEGLQEQVAKEQEVLARFISENGLVATPCTLVERVLGIWHSEG